MQVDLKTEDRNARTDNATCFETGRTHMGNSGPFLSKAAEPVIPPFAQCWCQVGRKKLFEGCGSKRLLSALVAEFLWASGKISYLGFGGRRVRENSILIPWRSSIRIAVAPRCCFGFKSGLATTLDSVNPFPDGESAVKTSPGPAWKAQPKIARMLHKGHTFRQWEQHARSSDDLFVSRQGLGLMFHFLAEPCFHQLPPQKTLTPEPHEEMRSKPIQAHLRRLDLGWSGSGECHACRFVQQLQSRGWGLLWPVKLVLLPCGFLLVVSRVRVLYGAQCFA